MKGYINYVAYIAISRGYLTDKYRTSEFRMSSNIILFGNRITSVLCNRLRTEASIVLFLWRVAVITVHWYLIKYEVIIPKNTRTLVFKNTKWYVCKYSFNNIK